MSGRIAKLSSMLKRGEISAKELAEGYISRIEREDGLLNAYASNTFEYALSCADEADKLIRSGRATALTGIPMALKDNICSDGHLTTCSSKILQGFKPYYDAAVWEKLRAQGAVMLGKTNMDEFAMGSASETSYYGAPSNPVDLSRVAGGSSGGSAAAVKADIAAYALGSDTGGSIRQPASFCGVVGFKPTYGAVSRYGLIAYASSLDQIGPLAYSVEDAAIIYDAIRGKDARDQTSLATGSGATSLDIDISSLKVGVPEEFFGEGVDDEVKEVIEGAVKLFERAGAKVKRVKIPAFKVALPVYYIISCAEASSNLGRYDGIRYGYRAENFADIDDMVVKTRTLGFGKEVKRRIMLGTYVLSSGYFDAYYKKACLLRGRIISEFDGVFGGCDILLTPTAPNTAFKKGTKSANSTQTYLADICTVPASIAGLPAVSLPCAAGAGGLPIGLQIIANRLCDGTALSAAAFFERTSGISSENCGEVKL